jgi:hypothetical protein
MRKKQYSAYHSYLPAQKTSTPQLNQSYVQPFPRNPSTGLGFDESDSLSRFQR